MRDNFDLKGYLRHGNKLLNEGLGGYMDLKPLNELDGLEGDFEDEDENPWMFDVDGTEDYSYGDWKCAWIHPGILNWAYGDTSFSELEVRATPNYDGDGKTNVIVLVNEREAETIEIDRGVFQNWEDYRDTMSDYLDGIEDKYADSKAPTSMEESMDEEEPEGNQYDGEYDAHTGPAITSEEEDDDYDPLPWANKGGFDFQDFMDTDLDGSAVERAIDDIIEEFDQIIKANVPKELQYSARIAVKKFWLEKIKNWRSQ